jgi:molybdopterin-guanine dinucleotide biosynthesis protein A
MSTERGTIPAVILAGGRAKPDFAAATGVANRALLPVPGGGTMLDRVVAALRECPSVGGITVVGDLPDSSDYRRVTDQGGFVENLFAGVKAAVERAAGAEHVLVATADIPFITPEAVEDFLRGGKALGADIVYPIADVEECQRRFPEMKRTALGLRDGRYTGGNVMLVRPEFLRAHGGRIAAGYAARKSPLRLALMLGLGTTLRAALAMAGLRSVLSVKQLETAASHMLGGTARAYVSPYPEIATDVDKVGDLPALERLTPRP